MRELPVIFIAIGTFAAFSIGVVTINAADGQQWALDLCANETFVLAHVWAMFAAVVGSGVLIHRAVLKAVRS